MMELKKMSVDLMSDFLLALCNAAATVHLVPLEERMHRFGGPQWGSTGVDSPMIVAKTMTRARANARARAAAAAAGWGGGGGVFPSSGRAPAAERIWQVISN